MLTARLSGEVDPSVLAQLARGRMRAKRDLLEQALQGLLKPHHRFLISEQLADIDALDEAIGRMSSEIAERLHPYEHLLRRLETIPGIKRRLAEVILAEIGPDMSRFRKSRGIWLLGQGCAQVTMRVRANGSRAGHAKAAASLRSALVEAAHAAIHCNDSYLSAKSQRLATRRGGKKATIAVGHTLLVIIYQLLSQDKDYKELGGHYFDEWDRQAVKTRLVHRLEKLGYEVQLEPTSPAI